MLAHRSVLCPTSHCPILQQEKGNLTPELAQVIDTIAATCKTIDQALQKVPWLEFWVAQVTKMFKVKHRKT